LKTEAPSPLSASQTRIASASSSLGLKTLVCGSDLRVKRSS
jgi:hypothetical protein